MRHQAMPPFAGRTFEVAYDGLVATNAYDADGRTLRYEITDGPQRGASGLAEYRWSKVAEDIFAISWQEADGATVVHIDDIARGTSQSFYTTPDGEFHRLSGTLRAVCVL